MVQSVDLSARQGLVGGGYLDLVIWRSSVSQKFVLHLHSRVMFKCVSSLLHGLFSNAGSLSWSSCVKTLVKNLFKTSDHGKRNRLLGYSIIVGENHPQKMYNFLHSSPIKLNTQLHCMYRPWPLCVHYVCMRLMCYPFNHYHNVKISQV